MQPSKQGNRVQYLRLRLYATAILTTVVGAPILLFLSYLEYTGRNNSYTTFIDFVIALGAGPVLAAAICGYLLGRILIDPNEEHDGWWAVLLGLRIGLLAYALMGGIYALLWFAQAAMGTPPFDMPVQSSASANVSVIVAVSLWTTAIIAALSWWYILPATMLVAYLLSRRYRKKPPVILRIGRF